MSKALPPVYRMKRLFRTLMGVTSGISISHAPSRGEHRVSIDFASSAEASAFYSILSALDPVRVDEQCDYSQTPSTGTPPTLYYRSKAPSHV